MLYKLKSCFLVFFILLVTSSFAQKEGYQWAFGQSCGLSFLSGKPDTFSTGIDAFNGCASICTSLGDLLFYTNGFFVDFYKNKNRTCNPDFTIQGTTGNFQSAIFIPHPHPDSSNLYFVFSSRSANCNCKYDKLYYSVIDLSPCSTGYIKGFIKSRSDIQITKTAVCGKLTAVKHANRKDYWVASYLINTDTFFAVQVGNNGVSSKLIKSNTGVYYKNNYTVNSPMKFSPDGKKLSSTAIGEPSFIADFNSKTGKLNNIIIFDSIKYDVVEFSSKSKFLYAVSSYSHIDQFDVSKKNKIDFINSKIRIDTINRFDYLQLAPDGKIYVASEYSNYLNVIHAPDSAGVSCRYRKKFVKLPRALDGPGLPDMVQSFFQKKTFEYRRSCTRDTVFFAPSNTFDLDSLKWDFGDTASGKLNFSRDSATFHIYSKKGFYTAKLISFHKDFSDTIFETFYLNAPQPSLGNDTAFCKGSKITLIAPPKYNSYLWNGVYKTKNITISQPGTYRLTTTDYDGCIASDTIVVKNADVNSAFSASDTALCQRGNSFVFADKSSFVNDVYSKSVWTIGDSIISPDSVISWSFAKAGVHSVKLKTISKLGCTDTSVRNIQVFSQNNIGFSVNDSVQCLNNNSFSFVNTSADTTLCFWNIGDQTIYKSVSISGKTYPKDSIHDIILYTQTIDGCKDSLKKQITILPSPMADFTYGVACSRTKTDFVFTGKAIANTSYVWDFNGESKAYTQNASFLFSNAGEKKVKLIAISDYCSDTAEKTILVKKQSKAVFTANDICESDSVVFVNSSLDADSYIWKFGDGKTSNLVSPKHKYQIPQSTTFLVNLIAISACADSVTNAITVNKNPGSVFTFAQNGDKLNLNATAGYSQYKWNFNTTDSIITTSENYTLKLQNWQPVKVCLTVSDINNCTSQSCQTITLGVKKVNKTSDFSIYPNPNSGTFTLQTQNSSDYQLKIFDLLGKEIPFTFTQVNQNTKTIQIPTGKGIYFVKIKAGNDVFVQRVLVY